VRVDPGDVSQVWFQNPADDSWHALRWEHADALGAPFSSEALDYARQLAAATHRFPDTGARWRNCSSSGAPGWPATGPGGGWRFACPSSGSG
jgi:hypothetical protein